MEGAVIKYKLDDSLIFKPVFNDVEKNRKDMFECVVKAADSAIYSNHILSNKELKWMTNVLREKKDV